MENKYIDIAHRVNDSHTIDTLLYYNRKADDFVKNTIGVDFSFFQNKFINYLPARGIVLDLGCGSGRDSKVFKEKGFNVVAVDGSSKLCELASRYIGQEVINERFQEYNPDMMFDGIWACASLLHLDFFELKYVIDKMSKKLKIGGCFYMSFKYGKYSGSRNGRYFTDMDETLFSKLIEENNTLKITEIIVSDDVRAGRESEKWLNIFLLK